MQAVLSGKFKLTVTIHTDGFHSQDGIIFTYKMHYQDRVTTATSLCKAKATIAEQLRLNRIMRKLNYAGACRCVVNVLP